MRKQYAQGTGTGEIKVMLIADFPSKADEKSGKTFESHKAFLEIIYNYLEYLGQPLDITKAYITYGVKEFMPDIKTGTTAFEQYSSLFNEKWAQTLEDEINLHKPKVILALGYNICKLLTGKYPKQIFKYEPMGKFSDSLEVIPFVIGTNDPFRIEYKLSSGDMEYVEEFSTKLDECLHIANGNVDALDVNYTQSKLVESKEDFDTLMDYCEQTNIGCFDYETTGLEWYDKNIFCTVLSISFQIGSSWIIPLYHREPVFDLDDEGNPKIKSGKYVILDTEDPIFPQETIDYFLRELERRFFDNEAIIKIAHNLKFDMHWNKVNGITKFSGRYNDTMLMKHLLNELTFHGLKDLTREYFPKYANYEQEIKQYKWEATPLAILAKYAGIDTDITLRLWVMFEEMLIKDDPESLLYILYRNLTMPTFFALLEAEHFGAKIDRKLIQDSISEAEAILEKKLKILQNFREFKRFDAHQLKKHNLSEIDKLREKIDSRTNTLQTKAEARKVKDLEQIDLLELEINNFRETILDKEGEVSSLNEDDKDDKKLIKKLTANIKSIQRKIDSKTNKITSIKSKTYEVSDDSILKKYNSSVRDLKTGATNLYKGFNFNSPKQLGELLYSPSGFGFPMKEEYNYKLKQTELLKTTAADYLKEIQHPFIDSLFSYRSISKMISTYYKGILDRIDEDDFLHASFLQQGTVTGRLSSRNPNLQNIPSRSKLDDPDAVKCLKMVKKFFITLNEDYYVLQFDYSQAELRLIANASGDQTMIDTYLADIDIHSKTASKLSEMDFDHFMQQDAKFIKKQRNNAKGANFGLVYDISIPGYMEYCKTTYGLVLTEQEAATHHRVFFETYPELKNWHKQCISDAKNDGYVRTLFGRKRRLPNILVGNPQEVSADERYSINSPIQGTGGEYTMFSVAILRHRLPSGVIFFNTVHDSLFFYIPKNKLKRTLPIIIDCCEDPPIAEYFNMEEQAVPMKIDVEISDTSWGDMVEYGEAEFLN